MSRDNRVSVRLTDEELEVLKYLTEQRGTNISVELRRILKGLARELRRERQSYVDDIVEEIIEGLGE